MATDIDEVLGSFHSDDYTVRLVQALCGVVPFAPSLEHQTSLAATVKQRAADARQPVLDRAQALCREEGAQKALWMTSAVDTADKGISAYSGLASAVKLYRSSEGERLDALETDPQQAADAAMKALALAYTIWRLFPGGPVEKVAAFRATDAGQAMFFYFAVVEVGMPFADNALVGGGKMMGELWERFGPEQTTKLAAITGEEEAEQAAGVLATMIGPLDSLVQTASTHLKTLSEAVATHLPSALDVGDKVAGVVATSADVLPVYRYLGALLVAEVAAAEAIATVEQETTAAAEAHPALAPVKYTVTTPDKDEIHVPEQQRRGCLGRLFFWK